MLQIAQIVGAVIESLELRRFLSAGPDPVVYQIGDQEIRATAAAADGRTGAMLLAGSIATVNDFAPGAAVDRVNPVGGSWSPFLARYGVDGQPQWVAAYDVSSAYADGTRFPILSAVAAGPDGSVFAAGTFSGSINFDTAQSNKQPDHTLATTPSHDTQAAHGNDDFLIKYDPAGRYLWGTLLKNVTTGNETVTGLTIDRFGSAYLAGTFAPIDNGVSGKTRSFLARFSSSGVTAWRATLAGSVNTIALDHHDMPWLATGGTDLRLFQFSAKGRGMQSTSVASADNSTGHGIGSISASSIAFDAHDNVILAGQFSRTFDFAPGKAQFLLGDKRYHPLGLTNIFLSKIRPDGGLVFAQAIGGPEAETAGGAGIDRKTGDILLAGAYRGAIDFDPAHHGATMLDAGFDQTDGDYPSDVFAARYTPTGRFLFVKDHTTLDDDTPAGFAMTPTSAFMAASNYDQKHDLRHIILFELPLS